MLSGQERRGEERDGSVLCIGKRDAGGIWFYILGRHDSQGAQAIDSLISLPTYRII